MKGYVVGDIHVTDPDLYAEYAAEVPAVIERYGGRYLVRGGAVQQLDGTWAPRRAVVIEFDSPDAARGRAPHRGLSSTTGGPHPQRSARTRLCDPGGRIVG
jgi:uncharacterized protein (DUF1330 family)